mmetsp:Transcript_125335/g.401390  ORF Transcript_125335/g.401390 Transcript_125335/m.401390 type:complete len:212 (+) Transcript_125335:236-871(+)
MCKSRHTLGRRPHHRIRPLRGGAAGLQGHQTSSRCAQSQNHTIDWSRTAEEVCAEFCRNNPTDVHLRRAPGRVLPCSRSLLEGNTDETCKLVDKNTSQHHKGPCETPCNQTHHSESVASCSASYRATNRPHLPLSQARCCGQASEDCHKSESQGACNEYHESQELASTKCALNDTSPNASCARCDQHASQSHPACTRKCSVAPAHLRVGVR